MDGDHAEACTLGGSAGGVADAEAVGVSESAGGSSDCLLESSPSTTPTFSGVGTSAEFRERCDPELVRLLCETSNETRRATRVLSSFVAIDFNFSDAESWGDSDAIDGSRSGRETEIGVLRGGRGGGVGRGEVNGDPSERSRGAGVPTSLSLSLFPSTVSRLADD